MIAFLCSALGAAALNGKLYVCGGFDGFTSLDTVECYSPDTNRYVTPVGLSMS